MQRVAQCRVETGGKQRRLEWQHAARIRRGALGKEQQVVPAHQPRAEQLGLCPRLAPVAGDKDRAGGPRQQADTGPARHLGLGDEIDIPRRVQHEDIQPGGMVGDKGAMVAHRRALQSRGKPQEPQHTATDHHGDIGRDRAACPEKRPFHQPHQQQQRQAEPQQHEDRHPAPQHPQPVAQALRPAQRRRRRLVGPGRGHRRAPEPA